MYNKSSLFIHWSPIHNSEGDNFGILLVTKLKLSLFAQLLRPNGHKLFTLIVLFTLRSL